jgi:lipopolysaccharide transport system ATP-binding protein
MSKDVVIRVENLSKLYRLGLVSTGTLGHDLNRFWAKIRGKEDPYLKIGETNDRSSKGESEYVLALKDINLEVKRGERIGIIGKNGAGKSTLLKILSQVTGPTKGIVKMKGRIASLLEVGTGFHGELTGRENIYMNGTILGMSHKEVTKKLDEIIDFAGVERYIDTPVKRYSSGMTVRLGFAVAAHLEPDILIVDEVLAVGDAEFQKKAIGKMKDVSEGQGRTILFVSHNMTAIKKLCNKGILLVNGKIDFNGESEILIEKYLEWDFLKNHFNGKVILNQSVNKQDYLTLKNISIVQDDQIISTPIVTKNFEVCVKYSNNKKGARYIFSIHIIDSLQNIVFTSANREFVSFGEDYCLCRDYPTGSFQTNCTIPKNLLKQGRYYLKIFVVEKVNTPSIIGDVEIPFNLMENIETVGENLFQYPGLVKPLLKWTTEKKENI